MVLMDNIETMLIIFLVLRNIILIITNKNNIYDTYIICCILIKLDFYITLILFLSWLYYF